MASCLAWMGFLSLAFVICKAVSIGWLIGGAFVLALTIWLVVMFREICETISHRVTGVFRITTR